MFIYQKHHFLYLLISKKVVNRFHKQLTFSLINDRECMNSFGIKCLLRARACVCVCVCKGFHLRSFVRIDAKVSQFS